MSKPPGAPVFFDVDGVLRRPPAAVDNSAPMSDALGSTYRSQFGVRTSGATSGRWNPRKADLDRWRAVFARALQDRGINAVATRQPVRAANRSYRKLWEEKAIQRGTLKRQPPTKRISAKTLVARADAIRAWEQIARALANSKDSEDVRLARDIVRYLAEVAPGGQEVAWLAAHRAFQATSEGLKPGDVDPKTSRGRSRTPIR